MSADATDEPNTGRAMPLSQHNFGWPEHRPRSYVVLTKNSTCFLSGQGLQIVHSLFRKPNINVGALYCAPKEWTIRLKHLKHPDLDLPRIHWSPRISSTNQTIMIYGHPFAGPGRSWARVQSPQSLQTTEEFFLYPTCRQGLKILKFGPSFVFHHGKVLRRYGWASTESPGKFNMSWKSSKKVVSWLLNGLGWDLYFKPNLEVFCFLDLHWLGWKSDFFSEPGGAWLLKDLGHLDFKPDLDFLFKNHLYNDLHV